MAMAQLALCSNYVAVVARNAAIPVSTPPVMQVPFRANVAAIQPFRVARCRHWSSHAANATAFVRPVLASDAPVSRDSSDEVRR